MALTRVSKELVDNRSVSLAQLDTTPGTQGQILALDSSGNLEFVDGQTTAGIQDIAGLLVASSTASDLSISYDSNSKQLTFSVIHPTNVSEFVNDANYLDQAELANYVAQSITISQTDIDLAQSNAQSYTNTQINNLKNGVVSDLDTLKKIGDAIGNDDAFSTTVFTDLGTKANASSISAVGFSGDYADIINKPTLFDGDYNSLTNQPILFDGNYGSLTGTPTLPSDLSDLTDNSALLFSRNYNDLTNKPSIPSLTGYATTTYVDNAVTAGTGSLDTDSISEGTNNLYYTNARVDARIPTNISSFTNDANYSTVGYVDTSISNLINAAPSALDTLNELAAALGDDANFSTTVSTNLSLKANSSDLSTVATTGSYDDLNDLPELVTDYGLISDTDVQNVATSLEANLSLVNVSTFVNDAGYITNGINATSLNNTLGSYYTGTVVENKIDDAIDELKDNATLDTLYKLSNAVNNNPDYYVYVNQQLNNKANTNSLSAIATSGSYNDLTDAPSIPNAMLLDADNTVTGSQIPATDNTYDLGNLTHQWKTIYGNQVEANYADLAERYESDIAYEPGTVVKFGGDKEITMSDMDTDVSVAGVISTNPGLKLNNSAGSDDTHPYLALRGRVPCKVEGQVKKGDLLVTSSLPGHAKSVGKVDMGAAVFAKSLEDYDGTDPTVIEVVII